jgi:hypothetical protein
VRTWTRPLKRHRVHDLVTLGHHQRRSTALVHAAKPPGIKIRLVQVLFARLDVLADLHRHATPRARITVAGNNNSAISISLCLAQALPPFCTVRFQNGRVKYALVSWQKVVISSVTSILQEESLPSFPVKTSEREPSRWRRLEDASLRRRCRSGIRRRRS